jgi:DNA-binding response OmpR family regulator
MDLEDLLAELGYDVVATAADLDTALELAKHERFDFAILDVNLAGIVLSRCRFLHEAENSLPLLDSVSTVYYSSAV